MTLENPVPLYTFLRFIFTGALNTLVGYSAYLVFLYLGLPYGLALLLSTVLGIAFNYFSFARLVFSAKIHWRSFRKFIFAYTFVYLGNLILLSLLIEFVGIDSYIGQLVCLPINVMMSYLLLNKWVYEDSKNADH